MSRYIWTVRCAWCAAVDTFSSELAAQSWATTHRCTQTPGDVPGEPNPTR
jgi:hypothetical protein